MRLSDFGVTRRGWHWRHAVTCSVHLSLCTHPVMVRMRRIEVRVVLRVVVLTSRVMVAALGHHNSPIIHLVLGARGWERRYIGLLCLRDVLAHAYELLDKELKHCIFVCSIHLS